MGEFVTKGDANKTEDMNTVPYSNFIGKLVYTIPVLGRIAQALHKYDRKDHCRRCDRRSFVSGGYSLSDPQTE